MPDRAGGATELLQDVNAVFTWGGQYHVMHQIQANSSAYTSYDWGHLVSTDLVHWRRLPEALAPSTTYDGRGVFDGAFSIVQGSPVIMYDCVPGTPPQLEGLGDPPCVAVARPADAKGDPLLTEWTKDAANPCNVSGPSQFSGPSAIWELESGEMALEMILGKTTALYTTTDVSLHSWELANASWYETRGGGGGLFLPIPGVTPATSNVTHMLQTDVAGAGDGSAWFALGRLDESSGAFTDVSPGFVTIDAGCNFYGELGYVGSRATRRLLHVGYLQCASAGAASPFRQLSVPRVVTFDTFLQTLLANPVHEVVQLRGKQLVNVEDAVTLNSSHATHPLVASGGEALDLEVVFSVPSCPGLARGGGGGGGRGGGGERGRGASSPDGGTGCMEFGVAVGGPPDNTTGASLGAVVTININGGTLHQEASMTVSMGAVTTTTRFAVPSGDTLVDVRILADYSVFEVFVAGGRGVASITGTPTGSGAFAFSTALVPPSPSVQASVVMEGAQGWAMGCGWQ